MNAESENEYDADADSGADDDSWLVDSSESEIEVARYEVQQHTPTYANSIATANQTLRLIQMKTLLQGCRNLQN